MATPTSPNLAFAELAPHALHLAIISGRKIVAWHAFRPDAKAEIAAFVAEHKLAGLVRATILGDRIFLHLSSDAEASAIRQPAALQTHVGKLPHGFDGTPGAVVCDCATGLAPDAARVSPWLLNAFDQSAFATLRESLGELGLAPVSFTLAAPAHLGAVAAALPKGETAAVLIPGTDDAWLVWVTSDGVQALSSIPLGFTQIYESVQKGLGLKFRAAAGKLFFNDTYDFTEAAAKICEQLVPVLRPSLDGRPAKFLHIVGLAQGQSWFGNGLASALGLSPWSISGSSVAARLGLDADRAEIPFSAAALLHLAAAGSTSAPWIQQTVETLAAEALAKPKTVSPFTAPAAVAPVVAAPVTAPASAPVAQAAPVKPVLKPAAPTAVIKPAAAPKPAPKPAVKPAPKAMPAPVLAVSVENTDSQAAAPAAKRSKAPVFIAAGVGLVAAVVGLAFHFRSPAAGRATPATPVEGAAPANPAPTPAPSAPAPTPPAPAPQPTTPVIDPVPRPAVVTPSAPVSSSGSGDTLSAETRKFANALYRMEIAEKGFIQSLSTARDEILVESAGGISLQGSYIGTDGRRKWFNVGGVDDAGYVATVRKSVRDGFTVFDVVVQHPRFSLEQSFTCLPDSVKVTAKFNPINLRDPRGAIAAVHSVRLAPVALNPALRMRSLESTFVYAMKPSTLRVKFDPVTWARDGAGGLQTIVAGENGVVFHFTENTDVARNTLNYEIQLGGGAN